MLFLTQKSIGNLKLYLFFFFLFMCVLVCVWKNFPYFPQTRNELVLFLVANNAMVLVFSARTCADALAWEGGRLCVGFGDGLLSYSVSPGRESWSAQRPSGYNLWPSDGFLTWSFSGLYLRTSLHLKTELTMSDLLEPCLIFLRKR